MEYIKLTDEQRQAAIDEATRKAKESIAWRSPAPPVYDGDSWTPEPWEVRSDGWTIREVAEPYRRVCHTYTPAYSEAAYARQVADSHRITDCVNALARIPDPIAHLTAITDENTRLQAALEKIEDMTLKARADAPDQARNWFSHIRSVAGCARDPSKAVCIASLGGDVVYGADPEADTTREVNPQ